jgi:hypothetical protein
MTKGTKTIKKANSKQDSSSLLRHSYGVERNPSNSHIKWGSGRFTPPTSKFEEKLRMTVIS